MIRYTTKTASQCQEMTVSSIEAQIGKLWPKSVSLSKVKGKNEKFTKKNNKSRRLEVDWSNGF